MKGTPGARTTDPSGSHATPEEVNETLARTRLLKVVVIYCTRENEERELTIDLQKAGGLIWDPSARPADVEEEKSSVPGTRETTGRTCQPHSPGEPTGEDSSDPEVAGPDEGKGIRVYALMRTSGPTCCYWNGRTWICPDDWE